MCVPCVSLVVPDTHVCPLSSPHKSNPTLMELVPFIPQHFVCHVVVKKSREEYGLFSTGFLKKGATVCFYAGDYLHWTHVGEGKSHAISVAFHSDHHGHVICGRGVREVLDRIPPALCGSIINSTEANSRLIDSNANVEPVKNHHAFYKSFGKDKSNRDVGVAAIAMVATRDIVPDEEILWSYPVVEMTDMTPCNREGILKEAYDLKQARDLKKLSRKRVIPQPLERV